MSEEVGRITRVRIKNYKSLADVDVTLEPLTVLVGRNGSGKSNFVDALMFMADCLQTSISVALEKRGGVSTVCRKQAGDQCLIFFGIEIEIPMNRTIAYEFTLNVNSPNDFTVVSERCNGRDGESSLQFVREKDIAEIIFADGARSSLPIVDDVPELVLELIGRLRSTFSGRDDRASVKLISFRDVIEYFGKFVNYEPDIEALRKPQYLRQEQNDILLSNATNSAAIIEQIWQPNILGSHQLYVDLIESLGLIVTGITNVVPLHAGSYSYLGFNQNGITFEGLNMSDGTLRAFTLLLAVYQETRPFLTVIEEPEINVHPAAAGVLMDAFRDGAQRGQILLTTHSPDLLDYGRLTDDQIRIVEMVDGETRIEPLGEGTRSVIQDRLSTPGELLRMDELSSERRETDSYVEPDPELDFAAPNKS